MRNNNGGVVRRAGYRTMVGLGDDGVHGSAGREKMELDPGDGGGRWEAGEAEGRG